MQIWVKDIQMKPTMISALVAALLISAPTHAALQDRDIDKNGQIDAFYDTTLNITWLRNANMNGEMTWHEASTWAANLEFGGFSDWRLPEVSQSCDGYNCQSSEMGHLWYVDLGNVPDSFKPGSFINMVQYGYWTGSTVQGKDWWGNDLVWQFLTNGGYQRTYYAFVGQHAIAVRDGDVLQAVPEPETYAVFLAGLGLIGGVARRHKLQQRSA